MNILSAEQMLIQEKRLLSYKYPYKIHYQEYKHMNQHDHHVLLEPSPQGSQSLQRSKIISRNIRGLPVNHPNASLRVFSFALLSLIYQEKFRDNQKIDNSKYILQSLKCSLYSTNLNLNIVNNYPKNINSTEIKAELAHLFQYLDGKKKQFQINKKKYLEWILYKNAFILDYIVIFLRCILSALQIQNALNWNAQIQDSQALINLFDYFDVNNRCFGNIILLYEEGFLIYVLEDQILFGEYYENLKDKENDEKKQEFKKSLNQNMVQSFFEGQRNALDRERENKKKGIVDSDMKLFNFMLESAEEDINMKQSQMVTPTFLNGTDTFHFGQKKRQQIKQSYHPDDVRYQFQKLIMDECEQSLQFEPNDSPKDFNRKQQDQITYGILKILDNSIHEDSQSQSNKNLIQLPKYRMSLQNKKKMNTFANYKFVQNENINSSPDLLYNNKLGNDSQTNDNHVDHFQCSCFDTKLKKNKLAIKVFDIKLNPTSSSSSSYTCLQSTHLNYRSQRNIKPSRTDDDHDTKSNNSRHVNVNCPQEMKMSNKKHIPSFLKKKQNQYDKSAYKIDEVKSKKSVNSDNKIKADINLLNKLKHQSGFLDAQHLKNNLKAISQAANKTKINYVSNNNNQFFQRNNNDHIDHPQPNDNHNSKEPYLHFKSNNKNLKMKTSTNVFDKNQITKDWSNNQLGGMKKQYQINSNKQYQINSNNINSSNKSSNAPGKFFAGNIIAPTLYINSNNESNNNKSGLMLQKATLSASNSPKQMTKRYNNINVASYNDYKQTMKP